MLLVMWIFGGFWIVPRSLPSLCSVCQAALLLLIKIVRRVQHKKD